MRKILLVSDSGDVGGLMALALSLAGYAVKIEFDRARVVQTAQAAGDIQGIVIDVLDPPNNGVEVLRALSEATVDLPIVMVVPKNWTRSLGMRTEDRLRLVSVGTAMPKEVGAALAELLGPDEASVRE